MPSLLTSPLRRLHVSGTRSEAVTQIRAERTRIAVGHIRIAQARLRALVDREALVERVLDPDADVELGAGNMPPVGREVGGAVARRGVGIRGEGAEVDDVAEVRSGA